MSLLAAVQGIVERSMGHCHGNISVLVHSSPGLYGHKMGIVDSTGLQWVFSNHMLHVKVLIKIHPNEKLGETIKFLRDVVPLRSKSNGILKNTISNAFF